MIPLRFRRPDAHAIAFAVALFVPAAVATACPSCSGSSIGTLPGFGAWYPQATFVMPILAAVLERPLLTLAGCRRNTLALSIQANALSSLAASVAGIFVFSFLWSVRDPVIGMVVGLGFPAGVVAGAAAMEWGYCRMRTGGGLKLWPFFAGNLFSALTIGLLPVLGSALNASYWIPREMLRTIQPAAFVLTAVAALVVYAASFAFRVRREDEPDDRAKGFLVAPPPAVPVAPRCSLPPS